MSLAVGKTPGGLPAATPESVRAARLVEAQAKVTGGAGNFTLAERAAREKQRSSDLFAATRDHPTDLTRMTERAAAAAATGDQKHPPPRTWRDLLRFRRRRPHP